MAGGRADSGNGPQELAVKLATRNAIRAAGGQEFIAAEIGKAQSRLSDYGSPHKVDSIPACDIVKVEALGAASAGHPHITRALARAQGFELFAMPDAQPRGGDFLIHAGAIATEAAEITSKICIALADDQKLSAAEIRQSAVIQDAEDLIARAVSLLAELRAAAGE